MSAALKISDELRSLVAAQCAARPIVARWQEAESVQGDDEKPRQNIQSGAVSAPTRERAPRRIRCHDRAGEWLCDVHRAASDLTKAQPDQAEAIAEALEREIEAGPDFARTRRGSDFRAPPKVNTDRNFIARLMFIARMVERKSWNVRRKGAHGGTLGKAALRLLEVLLYVVNKRGGYLSPSYDTLAKLCQMSRRAIVTAMGVLKTMGFVTIHRRIKRVQTPFGAKVVQDTNAYEYQLPKKGLGALACAVFARGASECKSRQAREESIEQKAGVAEKKAQETCHTTDDRWWMHDPIPTGAGGYA